MIKRSLKISQGLNVTTIAQACTVKSVRSMLEGLGRANIPCATFNRNTLPNHASSASHKGTVALEAQQLLSATSGGISEAVETAERKAMIGLMKWMY